MPTFVFSAPTRKPFSCELACRQCAATARSGQPCRKRACIGVPLCWVHLAHDRHLRIKQSPIEGAGLGLFAFKPGASSDDIVFRTGSVVAEYGGAVTSKGTLDRRYGGYTAPYGIHVRGATYEDAACTRGIGSLANHAPSRAANARYGVSRAGRSVVIATKNIRQGREVLCNYGGEYRLEEGAKSFTSRRVIRS